jgi:hypothetical protein
MSNSQEDKGFGVSDLHSFGTTTKEFARLTLSHNPLESLRTLDPRLMNLGPKSIPISSSLERPNCSYLASSESFSL